MSRPAPGEGHRGGPCSRQALLGGCCMHSTSRKRGLLPPAACISPSTASTLPVHSPTTLTLLGESVGAQGQGDGEHGGHGNGDTTHNDHQQVGQSGAAACGGPQGRGQPCMVECVMSHLSVGLSPCLPHAMAQVQGRHSPAPFHTRQVARHTALNPNHSLPREGTSPSHPRRRGTRACSGQTARPA